MKTEINAFFKKYKTQGAVIALINRNGEILSSHVYNDEKTTYPVSIETRFGIASMTKFFTSLAILKCQSLNLCSIEDSIATYLPTFEDETIKIKHFMTHTSGIFPQKRTVVYDLAKELGIDTNDVELAYDVNFAEEGQTRVIQQINNTSDRYGHPGDTISYFNDGYGLLSEIVRIVGPYDSYAAFMDAMIFKPLGMNNTTVAFLSVNHDSNTSAQYQWDKEELIEKKDYYDNAFVLNGGGAIKSTINDLSKTMAMLLNTTPSIVDKTTLQTMWEPHVESGYFNHYGYGLEIHHVGNHTLIGHGGSLTGVSSAMVLDQDSGLACVILCNTTSVPVTRLARKILCDAAGINDSKQILPEIPFETSIIGSYAALEGYGLEITSDSVIILNKSYTYKTHARNYLTINVDDQQVFLRIIMFNDSIVGVQNGLRILMKQSS